MLGDKDTKKQFDDTKFGRVASAFIDIVWAGILWLVCCIGVVTIGPACCALYHTVVKCIRHERGSLTKEFFHAFGANFKTALPIWIVYLIFAAASLLNRKLLPYYLIPVAVTFPWMFSYISRFSNTVITSVKNAAVLSIRNIGRTLGLILILAAAVLAGYLLPVMVLILPGFVFLAMSFFIEPVFKKITIQMEDSNEDKWYNE